MIKKHFFIIIVLLNISNLFAGQYFGAPFYLLEGRDSLRGETECVEIGNCSLYINDGMVPSGRNNLTVKIRIVNYGSSSKTIHLNKFILSDSTMTVKYKPIPNVEIESILRKGQWGNAYVKQATEENLQDYQKIAPKKSIEGYIRFKQYPNETCSFNKYGTCPDRLVLNYEGENIGTFILYYYKIDWRMSPSSFVIYKENFGLERRFFKRQLFWDTNRRDAQRMWMLKIKCTSYPCCVLFGEWTVAKEKGVAEEKNSKNFEGYLRFYPDYSLWFCRQVKDEKIGIMVSKNLKGSFSVAKDNSGSYIVSLDFNNKNPLSLEDNKLYLYEDTDTYYLKIPGLKSKNKYIYKSDMRKYCQDD